MYFWRRECRCLLLDSSCWSNACVYIGFVLRLYRKVKRSSYGERFTNQRIQICGGGKSESVLGEFPHTDLQVDTCHSSEKIETDLQIDQCCRILKRK